MSAPKLRPATPDDLPAIVALLEAARLPAIELELHLDNVVVGELEGRVVACGGLEASPEAAAGLVRSMAVDEPLRGRDIGTAILQWVEARAAALRITQLFLFTVGAPEFYRRFGYEDATLDEFPDALRGSAQYRFVRVRGNEWGIRAMKKTPH
jgi:N-acetylglutamate synthase-like GNAT family acetyltransferase